MNCAAVIAEDGDEYVICNRPAELVQSEDAGAVLLCVVHKAIYEAGGDQTVVRGEGGA